MAGEITGPPSLDLYGMLSGIGDTIRNNGKQQREQAVRDAFKDGFPKGPDGSIDFNAIGNIALKHGTDLTTTLGIAKLAEDQRKSREELAASADMRAGLNKMFQFGPQPAQQPPGTTPYSTLTTPVGAPRAPVMPSDKVWGDKEAEDAGLYEKPSADKRPRTDYSAAMLGNPQQPPPQSSQPQPTQAQGFQGIGVQHIPFLIGSLSNPRLPTGDRDLAGKLLNRALDDAKEPEKIRTLTALKEQSGYPGTILQLEMEMRKHSSSTVNIDQRGETEEVKAAGKAAGERRAAMFGASDTATKNLSNLTRVQTLLDNVDQGKLQPSRMSVSAWAKSFGMNDDFAKGLGLDPKKVGDSQAVQAMTNELVLGKIGAGGLPANNFSDADRQFLTDTLPKLGNDPRANKLMIESARRVHQDSIQRALDYQTWKEDPANKGKGFEDFEFGRARRISQMDRFGDLRKQAESLVNSGDAATTSGNAGGIQWRIK